MIRRAYRFRVRSEAGERTVVKIIVRARSEESGRDTAFRYVRLAFPSEWREVFPMAGELLPPWDPMYPPEDRAPRTPV